MCTCVQVSAHYNIPAIITVYICMCVYRNICTCVNVCMYMYCVCISAYVHRTCLYLYSCNDVYFLCFHNICVYKTDNIESAFK